MSVAPPKVSPVRDPGMREYRLGSAVLTAYRGWCKGCDLCINSCPTSILALANDDRIELTDVSRCIFCGICVVRCPDFVFSMRRDGGGRQCSS